MKESRPPCDFACPHGAWCMLARHHEGQHRIDACSCNAIPYDQLGTRTSPLSDQRLIDITSATCLCEYCEPDLVGAEVRPMAKELIDLRMQNAELKRYNHELRVARHERTGTVATQDDRQDVVLPPGTRVRIVGVEHYDGQTGTVRGRNGNPYYQVRMDADDMLRPFPHTNLVPYHADAEMDGLCKIM